LRIERGLSQAQLAALAGIRKATLVSIERGETHIPEQRTLAKVAAVFGLSLEELRQQIGMHGRFAPPPVGERAAPDDQRFGPRAVQIAGLVDTLPLAEQQFVKTLCDYLHARRGLGCSAGGELGEG
jgi:transcriptional regulator with XRE-family HTH domain